MKNVIINLVVLLFVSGLCGYAVAADATLSDATAKTDAKAAATQPAEPTEPAEVPKTGKEALEKGKELIELVKAKKWFAFSAGAIWIFMFLLKVGRKTLGFMKKIPKRALWIIVCLLSVAAMVLAKLQADLSWGAAVGVLFSGPSVAFLNDLVKRGLLGKEPSPMNGEG
jgi:hypothetical protein